MRLENPCDGGQAENQPMETEDPPSRGMPSPSASCWYNVSHGFPSPPIYHTGTYGRRFPPEAENLEPCSSAVGSPAHMNGGARFYRCDFQVHTPRDINWHGADAVSAPDRDAYAKRFVAACRSKGLEAVAITDHHDLAFYPHIRSAAQSELDASGNPIPPDQKLHVFPGMELTLPIPCQAIILFDPEIPDELLAAVPPLLAIDPAPPTDSRTRPVLALTNIKSLQELYDRLNERPDLKGRFIVLPHVKDGGHGTLLRKGFAPAYQSMPCVGGYIDGSVDTLGDGSRKILNGEDANYGRKPLGVFQTSDSRRDEFTTLGSPASWVKWAVPTAEAIRQACLARHSRISQAEPRLPSARISSVTVSASVFLGPTHLDLNPQFNALIGGRGTGKSSLLEYIRWGLCDQPVEIGEDTEADIPNYARKRELLIKGTLVAKSAVVTIVADLNGVLHTVERNSSTGTIRLRIGSGAWTSVSEQDVRDKVPIQAYSQKQLSTVAVIPLEIQRLVNAEIQADTQAIGDELRLLADKIRQASAQEQRKTNLEAEVQHDRKQADSLKAQADALRAGLKGLSDEDHKTLGEASAIAGLESAIAVLNLGVATATDSLATAIEQIRLLEQQSVTDSDAPHPDLNAAAAEYKTALADVLTALDTQRSRLHGPPAISAPYSVTLARLNKVISDFKVRYEAAKRRSTSQESALQELNRLEKNLQILTKAITEKTAVIGTLGDPQALLTGMWGNWVQLHKKRSALVHEQCQKLHVLSGGDFRARVAPSGDPDPIKAAVESAFSKRNIKKPEEKVTALTRAVVSTPDPLARWIGLINEIEALTRLKDSRSLCDSPILETAGLTRENRESLRDGVTREAILDLRLTVLLDLPVFEFKTGPEKYISFDQASSGQQATALLKILLTQEGPPLLIDQPEEDLDNEIINDIAGEIWHTKPKRQLIFVSHNANIVVNGDAELVAWFDYVAPGDTSHGHIRAVGAIDVPDIRECITRVMEGGTDAFELRRLKYGF
mgnify:FL=1